MPIYSDKTFNMLNMHIMFWNKIARTVVTLLNCDKYIFKSRLTSVDYQRIAFFEIFQSVSKKYFNTF